MTYNEEFMSTKTTSFDGFTKKYNIHQLVYNIHQLVYYEETTDIQSALQREKQLKAWQRKWKIELIKNSNPEWENLSLT